MKKIQWKPGKKLSTDRLAFCAGAAACAVIAVTFALGGHFLAGKPSPEAPSLSGSDATAAAAEENPPAAPESDAWKHVISHRGAAGEEEEHSFASYDLAVLYGSRYIEQDAVLSAEGTLYVSHDLTAKRLTGMDWTFSEMTDEDIDALRTETGEPIHRLSDVFERYGDSVTYVVELKDEKSVDAFVYLVDRYGNQDHILLQCFKASVLREVDKVFPDMEKMFLTRKQKYFDAALKEDWCDVICVSKDLMTDGNVQAAHKAKKRFGAYTLDSTREIREAIDMGVDMYFTNYTAKALALEDKYRPQ